MHVIVGQIAGRIALCIQIRHIFLFYYDLRTIIFGLRDVRVARIGEFLIRKREYEQISLSDKSPCFFLVMWNMSECYTLVY